MTAPVTNVNLALSDLLSTGAWNLELSDMPQSLQDLAASGAALKLRVALSSTGSLLTHLETDDMHWEVDLTGRLPLPNAGEEYTLPVKISPSGRLQVQSSLSRQIPSSASSKADTAAVNLDIDLSKQLSQIRPEPIKLQQFVFAKLENINLPQSLKDDILQSLPQLPTSIVALGEPDELISGALVKSLDDYFTRLSNQSALVQSLDPKQVISQIKTLLSAFAGETIGGEISAKINDTLLVKTDIGSTMFASNLKFRQGDKLVLSVNQPVYDSSGGKSDFISRFIGLFASRLTADSPLPSVAEILPSALTLPVLEKSSVATQLLSAKLPAYNDDFLSNSVNFYQAALKGDASIWLGKSGIAALTAQSDTPSETLKTLNEFVASAVKETPLWRMVEIPVYVDNHISQFKIAFKKDDQSSAKQNSSSGARFVVETDFSQLGSFQFDGFVQPLKRNLELIVRTSQPLEQDFYSDIINLFKTSLYNLNYTGNIKINRQDTFINLYADDNHTTGMYI